TTRSRLVLTGAAALHTEAAFRSRFDGVLGTFHLQVATAIVQFGERAGVKTNTPLSIRPVFAAPVSDDFRSLWYCTVISILEDATRLQQADRYLDHALTLFPRNSEIQLLAGVLQEMRGSPRTSGLSGGDRRSALQAAEKHYRAVLATQPDRLEAAPPPPARAPHPQPARGG